MIVILLPLSIILLHFLIRNPGHVFIYCFLFPVVSLPIYIISKHEMGSINIAVEMISIIALLIILARNQKPADAMSLTPIVLALSLLVVYGFILSVAIVPLTITILGIKLLITPFFFATFARIKGREKVHFVRVLFIVQICNALTAILETIAGIDRLQKMGFEYGTNLRSFDSFLRAPGLALTNYELGSFSAAVLVLAYLILTNQLTIFKRFSKSFCVTSIISSLICLALSNFRSGMIFSATAILLIEVYARRRLIRSSLILILVSSVVLIAVLSNFFLLNSNSSLERQQKWQQLLQAYDWKIGSGIGFTGAVTRSSFAHQGSLIVTDNQFLTLLLQFGIVGLLIGLLLFAFLFASSNLISKCMIVAVFAMMMFVEVWDMTLFFSICLYIIYDGFSQRSSKSLG